MLQRFGTALFALGFAVLFGLFAVLSLLSLAAIVIPAMGLGWAVLRFRIATTLRRSTGRIPMGASIRIFHVATLRRLALCEYVSGAGGFVATLSVPAFLIGAFWPAVALLGGGFGAVTLASMAHRAIFSRAESVELVPAGE